jgi:hypothetical protein
MATPKQAKKCAIPPLRKCCVLFPLFSRGERGARKVSSPRRPPNSTTPLSSWYLGTGPLNSLGPLVGIIPNGSGKQENCGFGIKKFRGGAKGQFKVETGCGTPLFLRPPRARCCFSWSASRLTPCFNTSRSARRGRARDRARPLPPTPQRRGGAVCDAAHLLIRCPPGALSYTCLPCTRPRGPARRTHPRRHGECSLPFPTRSAWRR